MKLTTILVALAILLSTVAVAQQDDRMTVPKSMLTQDQISKVDQENIKNGVSGWSGIGKEVGEAVNSSMAAITTQTNNFAQTGVGKLTIALVVWKVIGDQLVHLVVGLLEIVVFVPLWVWSYRRICITRRLRIGKDERGKAQWKVIEYKDTGGYDGPSPRTAHLLAAIGMVVVIAITVFSY